MAELTYDEISKLLKADFETGKLYWLPRPVEMFPNGHSAKTWNKRFAGKEAFTPNMAGYCRVRIFDKPYRVHRIIWLLAYGVWPSDCIDHMNGIRTDNRLVNLRTVSIIENARNQKRSSKNNSGVTGVNWHKAGRKWTAQIRVNMIQKHLGSFSDFDEAVSVRKDAERKYGFHKNHGRN